MKRLRWKWVGALALAGMVGRVSAQGISYPASGCVRPPETPSRMPSYPSATPGQQNVPQSSSATQGQENVPQSSSTTQGQENASQSSPGMQGQENASQPSSAAETSAGQSTSGQGAFGGQGGYQGSAGVNTAAVAGSGLTSAADAGTDIPPHSANPVILPGLLTAADAQSARPVDRLFANYSNYDHFRVISTTGFTSPNGKVNPLDNRPVSTAILSSSGFNLNRFDVGLEKTLCEGRASVYVSAPFLDATNNSTGQPISGVGDINAGLKIVIHDNPETGSVLSGGFTVSAPTGRDTVLTTKQTVNFNTVTVNGNPPGTLFVSTQATSTTTLNPTYLQPYVSGLLVMDRFFVQDYFGAIVPTDDRVAIFINNDIGVGYQLYRGCPAELFSSVTPTLDLQALLPVNHVGTPPTPAPVFTGDNPPAPASTFGFSDQLFVTPGLRLGLGDRALLSTGVVVPVVGPKAFSVGGTLGFNFLF